MVDISMVDRKVLYMSQNLENKVKQQRDQIEFLE